MTDPTSWGGVVNMPNKGQIISFFIVLAVIAGGAWQALSRGEDLRMAKKLTQPAFIAQEPQPEPQPLKTQQPEPLAELPELEPAAPLEGEGRPESSGHETECLTEECQVEGLGALSAEAESAFVVIDNGSDSPREFILEVSTSTTAFGLLQEASLTSNLAIKSREHEFGVLVEAIGEQRSGQDGNYWLFYINGELSPATPDKTQVKPGDNIEFKFTPR